MSFNSININNIFSTNKNNVRPLDVHSLYSQDENNTKNKIDFSVENLSIQRQEKRNKLIQKYKKILSLCLTKINSVNKNNKTDMIYTVPLVIFGYQDYNSVECLNYLEAKLRYLHMDTLIVSKTEIFVSWLNVDKNKNEKNKEQNKKR